MPVVDVYNLDKKKVGELELADTIFGVPVREHLFHEVVRAQLAARRSGTAKTKVRSEVAGSTRKLYKQKGTGRARQGTKKAPHWVGGGTVFGPTPRSYEMKVNRKTRRAALCAALTRRQEEGRLVVLESFQLPAIKTKGVVEVLRRFDSDRALIVDGTNETLAASARNLPTSHYLAVDGLNVYDILRHDTVLMTREAVDAIQTRLG
ncbi:MAG: 50S ribosomal protein L4 [Deltaproteobacteria bacterium]|nr:50S ribosomal protein L4 [Deltaproteobacteria bacterium]MCB9787368.1 50S ribosomal protein L4 [Deltaproteobacteria bacterium]